MSAEIPQYFANSLVPVQPDRASLQNALEELQAAVQRGVTLIESNCPPPDPSHNHVFGSVYNGELGIALMALRLERQAPYLATDDMPKETFVSKVRGIAAPRINPHIQQVMLHSGRLSPLGSSSLGAVVVRTFAGVTALPSIDGGQHRIHNRDIATLQEAVSAALGQGDLSGGDEVLYGRAGLLLALLNIRTLALELDKSEREPLLPLCEEIPKLIDVIIKAGKQGTRDYEDMHDSKDALPLMWPWHEKYYAGAIHGVCGILAVLLACHPEEARKHYPLIAETISALCRICIEHEGHLPSSLPYKPSSRPSPFVQICHGAPGILILLAHARSNPEITNKYWSPEWDQAMELSSQKVWEQGLLYKGGGLCHGIAGNAWAFMLLYNVLKHGTDTEDRTNAALADSFLSRGLALLLQARQTQPFGHNIGHGLHYRMPDAPYSLFEGLAGTVAAWAEACVMISARLRGMEADQQGRTTSRDDSEMYVRLSDELGFPGFSTAGFL